MTMRWVWGTGWATATLAGRQRASGLDRCAYSGGPAPEVRGRLLALVPGWRRRRIGLDAGGTFDAVGDRIPIPGRARRPLLERHATHPASSQEAGLKPVTFPSSLW